jgi:hypothetical protein
MPFTAASFRPFFWKTIPMLKQKVVIKARIIPTIALIEVTSDIDIR